MKHSVLITGAAGFIGSHLAGYLLDLGMDVAGLDLPSSPKPADWPGKWFAADLRDARATQAVIQDVMPNYLFHLAALIKTDLLADLLTANVIGTQHLLDALAKASSHTRVLITGTSAEYGLAMSDELPIREENPLRPLSPYGVSKVAQSFLAAQYTYRYGLEVLRTRTFNLTGPGEPETLACSAFARQIVQIKLGLRPAVMEVGNLETRRDFLDVRDAVRAYWEVINKGESGQIYNVCSGSSVSIREALELLIELSGVRVSVTQTPVRCTRWDVPDQIGDSARLRNLSGWAPEMTFNKSLMDLLEDWQKRMIAE